MWNFAQIETSSDRSREFLDTSCFRVADGSRQTGGPILLRNSAGTLRSAADSCFTGSSLNGGCTRGLSSSSSQRQHGLDKREVYHLRLRPFLVCELDMLIFLPIEKKLHVSSGEQIAHATFAGTQDSSSPTQFVPLWSTQLEKSTSQKLDM